MSSQKKLIEATDGGFQKLGCKSSLAFFEALHCGWTKSRLEPPKKPWNDESPVKYQQTVVSMWCRISSMNSIRGRLGVLRGDAATISQYIMVLESLLQNNLGCRSECQQKACLGIQGVERPFSPSNRLQSPLDIAPLCLVLRIPLFLTKGESWKLATPNVEHRGHYVLTTFRRNMEVAKTL